MKLSKKLFSRFASPWQSNRRDGAVGASSGTGSLIEALEVRTLLSAITPASIEPTRVDLISLHVKTAALAALKLPASARFLPDLDMIHDTTESQSASPDPTGITPTQIRDYYGINSVSFDGVTGDGRGQTIAIVDAFNDPNIAADLATFDKAYDLPAPPSFIKMSQTGSTTNLPAPPQPDQENGSWAAEISMDVEWSHVIAPKANIVLVEANNDTDTNLLAAAGYAASIPGVSVVSMSFGYPETVLTQGDIQTFDPLLTTPPGHQGVTFFAATGDGGAFADGTDVSVEYPASSPNVIAVGGTTLTLNDKGTIVGETGWSGSGGGISTLEPQPPAQEIAQGPAAGKEVPDVAFDADPNTGVNICDSFDFTSATPWAVFGGTSFGSPCWAAMTAIVNQGLAAAGSPDIGGTSAMSSLLYSRPASEFNQIASGNNGYYNAAPGFNLVTGLGTPIANKLLPDLATAGITPVINSLSANPASEASATTFTLTASKIVDAASPISKVAFYRQTNGTAGLQTGSDLLLGTGTSDGHGDWTLTVNTVGLPSGKFTYYAVATDARGVWSQPATTTNVIASAKSPAIGSLTATPSSENEETDFTLTANNVSEKDGTISKVEFFRESNQQTGFQGGLGGDMLLATETNGSKGWSTSINTAGLNPGTYTYYAVAFDSDGVSSPSVQTTNRVLPLKIISAMAADPAAQAAGAAFKLVASGVTETGKTISQVQFYREFNPAIGPQPASGLDTLLGTGTLSGSSTWTLSVATSDLAPATYHYYAIATDSTGLRSSPATVTNTISDTPPTVASFTVSPKTVSAPSNITLTVSDAVSPDVSGAITSVTFYRETNGTSGLQTGGANPDLVLGSVTRNASGTWMLTASTNGLSAGTYVYYAVVNDNHGGSTIVSATNAIVPPANDNFANAQIISGLSVTVTGTNDNATRQPGEPTIAGNPGGASVWYAWTAPASGLVDVSTDGSSYTTLLGVFMGNSVSTLTTLASSDANDSEDNYSSLSFKAVKGTRYDIAIDGHNFGFGSGPSEGAFVMNLSMPAVMDEPANDNFANAQVISGTSITVTGSNEYATKESREPNHAGNDGGASVWYVWTAPSSGSVELDTHGSNFDTLLAVYTGTSVSELTWIASNDDTSPTDLTSQLTFNAIKGTTYHIAVDGYNANTGTGPAEGSIVLHLNEK